MLLDRLFGPQLNLLGCLDFVREVDGLCHQQCISHGTIMLETVRYEIWMT